MKTHLKRWLKRLWTAFRLLILMLAFALLLDHDIENPNTATNRILAASRGYTFNYVGWEANALYRKLTQELTGFHAYIPESERKILLLDYFDVQRRLWQVEAQIEQASGANNRDALDTLSAEHAQLESSLRDQQMPVEHIIEGQVSSVLRDEGFGVLGQILPPVTMHFLDIPDVLVVSPRDEIRTQMTLALNPMDFNRRVTLESHVAQAVPDLSVWITPIGGVGIYPSMITETDRAVVAFEITAHEWLHQYLIFFPLGAGYFSSPDTRIINETTATLFGNEMGNKVIEQFYTDELAAGQVYLQNVPDYRMLLAAVEGNTNGFSGAIDIWDDTPLTWTFDSAHQSSRLLADYLVSIQRSDAAQAALDLRAAQFARLSLAPPVNPNGIRPDSDSGGWIHHTRVMTDYLLSLNRVDAAEMVMENGRQHTGQRILNQAWFAFNAGYQSNPVIVRQPDGSSTLATSGGGGDPIGAAIYEIRARSASLKAFIQTMRDITTREQLFAALETLRAASDAE